MAIIPRSGLTDDVPQGGLIISLPQRWSYSKPATAVVLWQSCRKVVLQTPCRFAAVHGGVIMLREGLARRKTVRQSVRPDIFYAPRLLLTQGAAEEASVTTSRSSTLGSHDATQGCCEKNNSGTNCQTRHVPCTAIAADTRCSRRKPA